MDQTRTLYRLGIEQYGRGELDAALRSFQQHIAANPTDHNGYICIGVILEAKDRLEEALDFYCKAVALRPDPKYHHLIGSAYQKLRHLGKTKQEAEHYASAIRLQPDFADAWHSLAGLHLYQGDYDESIRTAKCAIDLKIDEPRYYHTLALAHFFRGDDRAARDQMTKSNELAIARWDQQLDGQPQRPQRRWFADPHRKSEIFSEQTGAQYGQPTPNVLGDSPWTLPSLIYQQQQVYQITLHNVCVEGLHGIVYDDEHVYCSQHVMIQGLWRFFTEAPRRHPRESITVPKLASIHQPDATNYYHWTVECLTRLLLLQDQLNSDDSLTVLVPSANAPPFVDESLKLLRLEPSRRLPNQADRRRRYFAQQLCYIDWRQPLSAAPTNELAAAWYPPREGLRRLRRKLAEPHPAAEARTLVIYTSRSDSKQPRHIENEMMLVEALQHQIGDRLVVFVGDNMPMTEQIDLFRRAHLVIGPHGAALTNTLFCAPGTRVVEFPVVPPVLNHFAHLAMALDLDYWLVPQISTHYQGHYTIDTQNLHWILKVVEHLMSRPTQSP